MKLKLIMATLASGLILYLMLLSNAAAPTATVGDCTGSPFNSNDCNSCHSAIIPGSFQNRLTWTPSQDGVAMTIQPVGQYTLAYEAGWDSIKAYRPGQTYLFVATPSSRESRDAQQNGIYASFGLQLVALLSDSTQAGAFVADVDTNLTVTTLNGIDYVEHKRVLRGVLANSGTLIGDTYYPAGMSWTAPAAGSGDVTFYAAGMATDERNTTTGDTAFLRTFVIPEDTSTIVAVEQINLLEQVEVYPNPTTDVVNLQFGDAGDYDLFLIDLSGKRVFQTSLTAATNYQVDMTNYPAGTYMIHLSDGKQVAAHKIVKQ